MKTIRLIALALGIVLLLPLFASCASGAAVVSCGNYSVSRSVFQYLCCLKKTDYLYEANRTNKSQTSTSQLVDSPAIWAAKDADGNTVADALKNDVLDNVKWLLYLSQYAKDQGQALSGDQRESVKNSLNELVVKNFKTKSEFNKTMKSYGITYDSMYEYYLLEAQAYVGEQMLFGERGKMEITEDSARSFFEKNYVTVGVIYINNQTKTLANGKTVYLPEAEAEAKTALAEELYQRLLAGEDFAELTQTYSDWTADPDSGSTYTFARDGFVNEEAEDAAFALSVGKIAKVETDKGIYLLIRRGLNKNYFEHEKDAISETLKDVKKKELLSAAEFTVDENYIAALDVADLTYVR